MQKQFTEAELNLRAKAYYDTHFNHTLHAHIDIAGDLVAGTLLSQILWWFAPTPQGTSKLRVFKDGHYWLVKNREDWWDEIRISPKQYDRAIKVLEQKGLIIKKLYKFNGNPTTHIRPNFEQLEVEIEKWLNDIKKKMIQGEIDEQGGNSNFPKGKKPEESRLEPTSPWMDSPEEGGETQGYQGESPNPLETLVFTQRGKTDLTNGEKRNHPNGEIFNREYKQKDVVVVEGYKSLYANLFKELPTDNEIIYLLNTATAHGKDLEDCIRRTKLYADLLEEARDEKLKSPVGAIQYEIVQGWNLNPLIEEIKQKEASSPKPPEGFKPYNWLANA